MKVVYSQDPNELVCDGTAMHWLVKSNMIPLEESKNWTGKVSNQQIRV